MATNALSCLETSGEDFVTVLFNAELTVVGINKHTLFVLCKGLKCYIVLFIGRYCLYK